MKLYNKINKYKLGIIGFSILLSGCSISEHSEFKQSCSNSKQNYMNNSLVNEYYKEKNVYIKDNQNLPCGYSDKCRLLENRNRWDSIEVFLGKDNYIFPPESGLYKVYRDYSLTKCIVKYHNGEENIYSNEKGKFCIAAFKLEKPTANIFFDYTQTEKKINQSKIFFSDTSIYVNSQLFIKKYGLDFASPTYHDTCGVKDSAYMTIMQDFR